MDANNTIKYLVRMQICTLILIFFINKTSAQSPLAIDNNGNVGIGTDQPQTKLHVAGDLGVNGILDLGINQQGREPNAGKIGYGTFDNGSLCIVGAGNDGSSRRITMWAEGG